MMNLNEKSRKDTIYCIEVNGINKTVAWIKIRGICTERGIKSPKIGDIVEITHTK